ncbi:hypothetical protein ACSSVY_001640 [Roseovarius sp. MBR-51]
MWFDAQAALANIEGGENVHSNPAPPSKPANPNVASVASVAGVAGGEVANPILKPDPKRSGPVSPYGASVGGRLLTYTGRVVSLEAWRTLSEWERHGASGGG